MTQARLSDPNGRDALKRAEAALARVQRSAQAATDGRLTANEAIEQIMNDLEARPALDQVREALSRYLLPSRPH